MFPLVHLPSLAVAVWCAAAPSSDGGVLPLRDSLQASWDLSSARCLQTRTADACDGALLDWFQLNEVHRASRLAPQPSVVACATWDLRECLATHFGAGRLVTGVNSDFLYAAPSTTDVRMLIGTAGDAHGLQLRVFVDRRDSSEPLRGVVERASPLFEGNYNQTLRSAPLGSDRFIDFTQSRVLERDTPAHGGFVVCDQGQRIERLGRLIGIALRGVGYHPAQSEHHLVYRYATPCDGIALGAGTKGVRVGRSEKGATTPNILTTCSAQTSSCTVSMRLQARVTERLFHTNTETQDPGTLRPQGDLNHDGVMDYLLSSADAGGGTTELFLSTVSGWETVASFAYLQ